MYESQCIMCESQRTMCESQCTMCESQRTDQNHANKPIVVSLPLQQVEHRDLYRNSLRVLLQSAITRSVRIPIVRHRRIAQWLKI